MKPHVEHVGTALLQLSFALKLWHYVSDGKIPRESFDIDLIIDYHGPAPYVMRAGEFETDGALINAAANNIWICFSSASITLWEAIRESTGKSSRGLDPQKSDADQIASLSYAIRCCFAHGSALPVWKLDKKYQCEYQFGRGIDLRQVDGQPFKVEDVGGYDVLKRLRLRAVKLGMLPQ